MGAVGVPVNEGDAIVALKAISLMFAVILEVFELILFVFVVTLASIAVILAVFAEILFVFVVIFAVLVAISFVLVAILVVLVVILLVLVVILAVLVAIKPGNVLIVAEFTPPTLLTVGKSAVPPKSFVNLILPFILEVASGVADPPTIVETNSVVAICEVLVPAEAVGAVGIPVNAGEAIVALNAILFVFVVILEVLAVTLVSNPLSAAVALEISAVILLVLDVTLVSKADSALVALVTSAVMLFVLDVILF